MVLVLATWTWIDAEEPPMQSLWKSTAPPGFT